MKGLERREIVWNDVDYCADTGAAFAPGFLKVSRRGRRGGGLRRRQGIAIVNVFLK